jgi:hypothetical protein
MRTGQITKGSFFITLWLNEQPFVTMLDKYNTFEEAVNKAPIYTENSNGKLTFTINTPLTREAQLQKKFNIMYNVGRAKYVVNYHNGVKKHEDGNPFFDIAIFKSKLKLKQFIKDLRKEGYSGMDNA